MYDLNTLDTESEYLLPEVVAAYKSGYHVLDLLFIGFSRCEQWHMNWHLMPIQILEVFCDYYCVNNRDECKQCDGCKQRRRVAVLCGRHGWLCEGCRSKVSHNQ